MSKIGAVNLALTNDDMGEAPVFELIDPRQTAGERLWDEIEIEQGRRAFELGKYTDDELTDELRERGITM